MYDSTVVRQLERALAGDYRGANGEYPYIAFDNDQFVELLMFAYGVQRMQAYCTRKPLSPTRFIDVGCGIGSKVSLAHEMLTRNFVKYDVRSFGLEKYPAYCEAARKLIGKERVIEADGITFDKYHQFDLVYFYRPIADPRMQAALEQNIIEQLLPGSVILSPMYESLDRQKLLDKVTRGVFVRRKVAKRGPCKNSNRLITGGLAVR